MVETGCTAEDRVSPEAAFLAAAGFIVVATGVFAAAAVLSTDRTAPGVVPGD